MFTSRILSGSICAGPYLPPIFKIIYGYNIYLIVTYKYEPVSQMPSEFGGLRRPYAIRTKSNIATNIGVDKEKQLPRIINLKKATHSSPRL